MKPSSTNLRKVLLESHFNPQKPGPLTAILETGTSDYLINRSRELLNEAISGPKNQVTVKLRQVISLLGIARLHLESSAPTKPKETPVLVDKEAKKQAQSGKADHET